MHEISVILPVHNAERHVREAIGSVLRQSWKDLELIIIDEDSSDATVSLVRSFDDSRIRLARRNGHDLAGSLNFGLSLAQGQFIALMDSDGMMHTDRLRVQHAVLKAYPEIAVCGTWVKNFGFGSKRQPILRTLCGLVEKPLLRLIQENFMPPFTAMARADFIQKHQLVFKDYAGAEELKFWVEVAQSGGQFYVENQLLTFRSMAELPSTKVEKDKMEGPESKVIGGVLRSLVRKNKNAFPELSSLYNDMIRLSGKGILTDESISAFILNLFLKNEKKLKQ